MLGQPVQRHPQRSVGDVVTHPLKKKPEKIVKKEGKNNKIQKINQNNHNAVYK